MLTAFCRTAVSYTLYATRPHLAATLSKKAFASENIATFGRVGIVSFIHTENTSEHHVPWSLFIAERDRVEQENAQRLDKLQQEKSQRMFELGTELGQLTAQNEQLLREVVYAKAEIDVRGALEIIARIEEVKIPSKSKKRRGVQQVLAWMVTNDKRLQRCMERICEQHKLDEARIKSISQDSLYGTACEALHGTSHTPLAVCEQHPWSPNSAAAVCILLETYKLDYQYRDRNGKLIPSPYSLHV